ncbi:hypothetical protein [Bradyrhizobium sp. B117]|uniref:hypothetical protein n=1 Tax=Bradyrhizobium sp. B117 TaxID=3140246 RepID=UPI0031832F6F
MTLNTIATRIIAGESFAPSVLEKIDLSGVDERAFCHALELRSASIVRLALYENAVDASDAADADRRLRQLRNSIDLALQCVPGEGFLWFIRYWTSTMAGDLSSARLDDLAYSYTLSPFEGWIGARRNLYALAVYDQLPEGVQVRIRREFSSLVSSGLLRDAARSLEGPGWRLQNLLLPELRNSSPMMRQQFYNLLYAKGIDVDIPGAVQKRFPGWR